MESRKRDLIAKLKEISTQYKETVDIAKEMEEFQPQDNYERKVIVPKFPGEYKSERERAEFSEKVVHTDKDALRQMKTLHKKKFSPREPSCPEAKAFKKNPADAKEYAVGCLGIVAFVLSVLFGVGTISAFFRMIFYSEAATFLFTFVAALISIIAFVALLCGFIVLRILSIRKNKKARKEHYQKQAEEYEAYNMQLEAYEVKMKEYDLALQGFLEEYSVWREIYIKRIKEEKKIQKKLEQDRVDGANKIYEEKYVPAKNKLDNYNDIVSDKYLPVINDLIELLEANRADELKEAINLYEEIEDRKCQLAIEQSRLLEEQMRRFDENIRYQEEKQFRETQEIQRQVEAQQLLRDEERRHQEQMAMLAQQEEQRRKDLERHHREEMELRRRIIK